jgi:hypothetical protein
MLAFDVRARIGYNMAGVVTRALLWMTLRQLGSNGKEAGFGGGHGCGVMALWLYY